MNILCKFGFHRKPYRKEIIYTKRIFLFCDGIERSENDLPAIGSVSTVYPKSVYYCKKCNKKIWSV
jgi:hypothetical protein